ncbi:MAG: permease, partial [Desulfobacteraceae bacterium]
NITSLTVLFGVLGKRATAIYLIAIAVFAVACGLVLDQVYSAFGISARAMVGQAAEVIPGWLQTLGALTLLLLSIKPFYRRVQSRFRPASV